MRYDRESADAKRSLEELSSIQDQGRWEAAHRQRLERERAEEKAKQYMQPLPIAWIEFLEYKRWNVLEVAEMPDDYVFLEWGVFLLKGEYQMLRIGSL